MKCAWCGKELIEKFDYVPPAGSEENPRVAKLARLLEGKSFCTPVCRRKGMLAVADAVRTPQTVTVTVTLPLSADR